MAIINTVSYTAVITDIKSSTLNAFAQLGGTFYFGYVNVSNHAVVYSSSDNGASWGLAWDFGTATSVNVTASLDGHVVSTVTNLAVTQTAVYREGTQVLLTSFASSAGAVTLWPAILFLGGAFSVGSGKIGFADGGGGLDSTNSAACAPMSAVLGYGATAGDYNVVAATFFDPGVGWGGNSASIFNNLTAGFTFTQTRVPNWVGLNSGSYSGYLLYNNFAGVGTGGGHSFSTSVNNTRGVFYSGYPGGAAYVADRGMAPTHRTAFTCQVDGTQVCFFIDRYGLFGATVNDGVLTAIDASGTLSPFDKAKIYGNTPADTWSPYMYGAASQSGALTVFTVTENVASPQSMYRLSDTDPLSRPHAKNTQLLSQLTTVRTLSGGLVDPFAITPTSNALGQVRLDGTLPKYGTDLLIQACTEDGVVLNPNHSPGCSPVLRELMTQSGVPYSVVREMANDGDPNGHEGGNAIDVAGPSTSTVLVGASVSDAAYQEMAEITAFLRAVPSLFASVIHYDPITPSNSLFIWDGQLTTAGQFGGLSAQIVKDSISNIHISSSRSRLLANLKTPVIQAALGTGPGFTDITTGAATAAAIPDLFGNDRYVYVNDDGYIGSAVEGLAVKKEPAQIVNFW
jgi:hypothetical protein